MTFRSSTAALLAAAVTLAGARFAHPCSCGPAAPIEKTVEEYPVIFLGEAIERAAKPPHDVEITFNVVRGWKGEKPARRKVTTASFGTMCGYEFDVGRHYVVFAAASPSDPTLQTGTCTPTERAAEAAETIRVLDARFGGKTEVPKDRERPARPR